MMRDRCRRARCGWRDCDSGATAIETGLVMLVLVVFFLGLFEFGFGYWVWHTMHLAAADGGRYAMLPNSDFSSRTPAQVQGRVMQWLPSALFDAGSVPLPVVGSYCDQGIAHTKMTVTVTYQNSFLNVFPYALQSVVSVPQTPFQSCP